MTSQGIGANVGIDNLTIESTRPLGYTLAISGPSQTLVNTNGIDPKLLENAIIENNEQVIYLYAVWVKPASGATLQNWTGCSNMSINNVIALTDLRDNNVYTVAKLADGQCWMIENLRTSDNAELTLSNTNSPNLSLINSYSGSNPITSNYLSASTDPMATPWCTATSNQCINQTMLNNDNTNITVTNMTSTNSNVYSYGNYYNWYSATAGAGKYQTTSGIASGDICPTGWYLPDDSDGYSAFQALRYEINNHYILFDDVASKNFRTYPNNFIYSGSISGSSITRGDQAMYWSSNTGQDRTSITLFLDDNNAMIDFESQRYIGVTVRCMTPD